jgi:hypothetical protein
MFKKYKQKIAVFMIVLLLTIPFYASTVLAQTTVGQVDVQVANPVESCLEKKEESDEFVELLDSGPIKTLETIASMLYATCTFWSTTEAVLDVPMTAGGFCSDGTCKSTCGTVAGAVCAFNDGVDKVRTPLRNFFIPLCSLATCALCNEKIGQPEAEYSPANLIPEFDVLGKSSKEIQKTAGEYKKSLHLSPMDNIYVAIGCLCPIGILFNLRKLKTIYQTHSCCIEEACKNSVGTDSISTETCDRQLSEATCMYWEGSVFNSLIKILISFAAKFIAEKIFKETFDKLTQTAMFRTIWALFQAYQAIEGLQTSFQWLSQTFSEPKGSDLGFGKIEKENKENFVRGNCRIVEVDLNEDGLAEFTEERCIA